ncbi:MAG: hypothetical protein ACK41D_12035 [Rubricoccaceae bacterium]
MPSALLASVAAFLVALLGLSRVGAPAQVFAPASEVAAAAAERVALREVARLAALAPAAALENAETWAGERAGNRVLSFHVSTQVPASGAVGVAEVTVSEVIVGAADRSPVVLTALVRLAPR